MRLQRFKEEWKQCRLIAVPEKYRKRLEMEVQKPRPPMPSLRRVLTVRGDSKDACSCFNTQAKSLLFTQLSFDIREQVYRYIIHSGRFHIMRRGRRLAFQFCQAYDFQGARETSCSPRQNSDGSFWMRDDGTYWRKDDPNFNHNAEFPWNKHDPKTCWRTGGGILPLLMSCRKV